MILLEDAEGQFGAEAQLARLRARIPEAKKSHAAALRAAREALSLQRHFLLELGERMAEDNPFFRGLPAYMLGLSVAGGYLGYKFFSGAARRASREKNVVGISKTLMNVQLSFLAAALGMVGALSALGAEEKRQARRAAEVHAAVAANSQSARISPEARRLGKNAAEAWKIVEEMEPVLAQAARERA